MEQSKELPQPVLLRLRPNGDGIWLIKPGDNTTDRDADHVNEQVIAIDGGTRIFKVLEILLQTRLFDSPHIGSLPVTTIE